MRKFLFLFKGGMGCFIISSFFPTAVCAQDISVQNIEITQAIQTTNNTIQLVSQRSTAVRVTVGGGPMANVTGRLHVFVNGSEITPIAGLTPLATLNAPAAPNRNIENNTLNFELPAPTGITASANVDFSVTLDAVPGEINLGNNTGAVNDLTFIDRDRPNLFYTRVNYIPSGLGLPALADVQAGRGDMFVRGIFPVNDSDPLLYRQGLFPSLTWTDDPNGNGKVDDNAEKDNIMSWLASCRQMIVDAGLGPANNTFLYGWFAGNPINSNGWGQVNGFTAYGNTQYTRFQRTYAHELTHNFGLNHNSVQLNPEVGWDVTSRLPGNPGGNNTTGRVKPTTINDIMVAGIFTNQAWVALGTYNYFLSHTILGGDQGGDRPKPQPRVAILQGIFNRNGDSLLYLEPVFRFPWASEPSIRRTQGNYIARIVDNAGTVITTPFDATMGDDGDEDRDRGDSYPGFFELMVPVSSGREIASLQIQDRSGRVFRSFQRTAPPTIQIVNPVSGAPIGARTTVQWTVTDPDTPLPQMMFQAAYSPDGGQNWVPIGVDIRGTSFTFPSDEIQESQGMGVIRIYVSDGLNTAFADVTKLRTTAAIYKFPTIVKR